jgi:hypothetical protein
VLVCSKCRGIPSRVNHCSSIKTCGSSTDTLKSAKGECFQFLFNKKVISFNKRNPKFYVNIKTFTMDTLLTTWEMNLESERASEVREEIATWPSEPYTLDRDTFNWN